MSSCLFDVFLWTLRTLHETTTCTYIFHSTNNEKKTVVERLLVVGAVGGKNEKI